MLYKIVKITDLDGKDKCDLESANRIGRVVDIEVDNIIIGHSLFMECIEPNFLKSIITSYVKNVMQAEDGLVITTTNSIYLLVEKTIYDKFQ